MDCSQGLNTSPSRGGVSAGLDGEVLEARNVQTDRSADLVVDMCVAVVPADGRNPMKGFVDR
jgi:hypothetical protein